MTMLCVKFKSHIISKSNGNFNVLEKMLTAHMDREAEDEGLINDSKRKFVCSHCHRRGHMAKTCLFKKFEEQPSGNWTQETGEELL